jgi:hypothetical protein
MQNRSKTLINPSWIEERQQESAKGVRGPDIGKELIKQWIVLDGLGKK